MSRKAKTDLGRKSKGGNFIPALCNLLGMGIILVVIAFCLAMILPQRLGYREYNIMTGSMEPLIPVGSLILVEQVPPETIEPGDIIVFQLDEFVVAHRVIRNQIVVGEFVTKGDANYMEDINPVSYSSVIGRVKFHVARMGQFMSIYTTPVGKLYVLIFALCGVLFNVLAGRLRERNRERRRIQEQLNVRADG